MLFWRRDGLVAADEFGAAGTVGDRYELTPGRYVGAADAEDDGKLFEGKMKRLTVTLEEQFAESVRLELAIRANSKGLSSRED